MNCVICFEEKASNVIIPCGHQCACRACLSSLSICPICRKPFTSSITVFPSGIPLDDNKPAVPPLLMYIVVFVAYNPAIRPRRRIIVSQHDGKSICMHVHNSQLRVSTCNLSHVCSHRVLIPVCILDSPIEEGQLMIESKKALTRTQNQIQHRCLGFLQSENKTFICQLGNKLCGDGAPIISSFWNHKPNQLTANCTAFLFSQLLHLFASTNKNLMYI